MGGVKIVRRGQNRQTNGSQLIFKYIPSSYILNTKSFHFKIIILQKVSNFMLLIMNMPQENSVFFLFHLFTHFIQFYTTTINHNSRCTLVIYPYPIVSYCKLSISFISGIQRAYCIYSALKMFAVSSSPPHLGSNPQQHTCQANTLSLSYNSKPCSIYCWQILKIMVHIRLFFLVPLMFFKNTEDS